LIRSGIGGIGRLPERGFTGTYLVQHPDAQMHSDPSSHDNGGLFCKTPTLQNTLLLLFL
jgi:hypothetical protein